MTYIVGIRSDQIIVLIADSRVSFGNRDMNHNFSLKSGHIFPGCIYAASGDAGAMRDFIKRAKNFLTGRRTQPEFWDMFVRYFQSYDWFARGNEFQLLLSSRHSGEPRLYIADSSTATITECTEDIVTLGSGSSLLDSHLRNVYQQQHRSILDEIRRQDAPDWFLGYWYCLALTELAQGSMACDLNDIGVGGIFHFSYQTCTEEHRQHPAVYDIVATLPTQQASHYIYRITFEQMALVVENPAEQKYAISIDEAAWPKIREMLPDEVSDLSGQIFNDATAQPFYYFFGLGFADKQHRGKWLCHLNLGNNQFAVSREKIEQPFAESFVDAVLSGNLPAPGATGSCTCTRA